MLKTFRSNFKHLQWILWVVIAVFVIFVFVDWGMGTTRTGGDSEIAAQAGNIKIALSDFQREYRDTEDRYRQMYGKNWSPELLKMLNLPEQVLNVLIDRRILRQETERLHLSVSDDELRAKLLSMRDSKGNLVFVSNGAFVGDQVYRQRLSTIGMTPEMFEAQTRDSLLLEKLNRFLTGSVFVSDEEVEKDFSGRNVKAKIAYVLKPSGSVTVAPISDAEAEEHFKKNPTQYDQPEKRKARYLLVDTAKLRPQIVVTDADISNEYNANAAQYQKGEQVHARHILYKAEGAAQEAAAKAKADAALAKLKKGADFAALASAESDDPGSKVKGGDLGSFGRGQMVKEFEEAAFSAEPNALVGPVKTSYGYHVIQVLEKTPARVQPMFEVKEQIRGQLQEKKAGDEAKRLARDLADRIAKMGGKPSDDQFKKLAVGAITTNETEFLAKTDAPQGLGYLPAFTKALFSLERGEVSDPVSTPRGEAILRVAEIKPPGPPTFAEVKSKVIGDLAKKKQNEAAVQALTDAMAQDASVDAIAQKLNLKVETPESFGHNVPVPGLGMAAALTDAAFAANVGDVRGPIAVPDRGAVVFKLLEKTPFDRAAFDTQKEQIKDSLRSQKANRLMQAMIARRRTEMKLVVNRDLLARFTS